jgi:GDSL-like lipase/acylhydrolase family protein
MGHIVLLGDSIFDNAAYTRGEPDVVRHLCGMLPEGWKATLLAVDGAITARLKPQLERLPDDATHLVVSIGGNDVLGQIDMLSLPARSTAEALAIFAERVGRFEADYRCAIEPVIGLGPPVTLCTIYNGDLQEPTYATAARVALTLFNDVIVRVALEHGTGLIDLRLVCTERSDYANPIEPSGSGGRKIATRIAAALGVIDPRRVPA